MRGCRHQVSLTAGTVFHSTRKPLVLCEADTSSAQRGLDQTTIEAKWNGIADHELRGDLLLLF